MKKQRRLQIIFSAAVASGQLLSSVSADDQPALRPATAQPRPVPSVQQAQNSVRPVAYSTGEGERPTTVDQELQKLFHANGQRQAAGQGNIQLVQMSNNQAKQQSSKKTNRKKPSFFRRLFGSSNNKQIPGVGEPAPPIPRPPSITYDTNTTTGRRNGSVQARTVSQSRAVASNQAGFTTAGQPQANGTTTQSVDRIIGDRRKPGTDGEFINPFESQDLTEEQETLLDLDSLIEEPTNVVTPQKVEEQPVSKAVQSKTPVSTVTQTTDSTQAAGPFTGYQLETKQPTQQQAEAAPARQLPRIVSQQEQVVEETQTLEQATRQLPAAVTVEATSEVTADAVPLLQEPEMQLPEIETNVPNSEVDLIPLLEEEEEVSVALPPVQNAEVVSEESVQPVLAPKPVQAQPAAPRQTHADRISVLESQARREQQAYRIMARTGKTGFKGFCPVSLRDTRELIDSRPQYRAKFGLQTYYFSSPEAKSAFESNPTRYAPAAGGSDIVLLVNTSEEEPGSLDFSLWYRERLYLFRSRETRRIFADNPTKYANQY